MEYPKYFFRKNLDAQAVTLSFFSLRYTLPISPNAPGLCEAAKGGLGEVKRSRKTRVM